MKKNKVRNKFNFYERIIYFSLPFFYVLAIIPEEIFALISVIVCIYLLLSKKLKINFFNLGILTISLINWFSSFYFLLVYPETDFLRFLSSLNTILTWVAPALIIFNNSYKVVIFKNRIAKCAVVNLLFIFFLSLFGILLMRLNTNITILGRSLFMDDFINGETTHRLSLFFEYASLITFFIFINLGFLFLFSKNEKVNFFMLLISFVPIFFSNSRICLMAYIVIVLFYIFNFFIKRFPNLTKMLIVLILIFSIFYCLISFDSIQQIINDLLNLRSGSNTLRFKVYYDSLKLTYETNLLFGCGVKISYTDAVPYGSHSTFIGMIYKTGIIGFALFLILLFYVFVKIEKKKDLLGIGMFISFCLIMIFEDIDGKNWQMFYLFLLLFFTLHSRISIKMPTLAARQMECGI